MNDVPVWYLQRGPTQYGPYSWADVVQLAHSGHMEPTDLLWRPGDAAAQEARSIPGLLSAAPRGVAAGRGLVIGLSALVAALAIALIVVIVASKGDDSSGPSDRTTIPRTTAPRTTAPVRTTTTAPTTTEATTTVPETTAPTTTEAPTTTAAPTSTTVALDVANTNDLLAALPDQADLPAGWESSGDSPDTDLTPALGPDKGICGLINSALRAQQNGVIAYAGSPKMYTPDGGESYVSLYAFAAEDDAAGFVAQTAEQVNQCPGGFAFDIQEGDGEQQVDIFIDGYGDNDAIWHGEETETAGVIDAGEADERYTVTYTGDFSSTYNSESFSFHEEEIDVYERYGRIVVIFELYGVRDFLGFVNTEDIPQYTPTFDAMLAAADLFRPDTLSILRGRMLIV